MMASELNYRIFNKPGDNSNKITNELKYVDYIEKFVIKTIFV